MRKYSAIGTRAPSTSGVSKSGSCGLPSTRLRLQRLAISTVLASALGRSANSASICACDLKYCSRLKRLTRRGLASISPSATQTRASCASWSSGPRNWTAWVATTGSASSRRELDRGAHVRFVAGQAAALQLDVEAAREGRGQTLGERDRARVVAGEQRAAERARGRRPTATIRPSAHSASHDHSTTAWPLAAFSSQPRDSSSHRLR